MLPENAVKIVEDIMFAASRIRSNAVSELNPTYDDIPFRKLFDEIFPFISQNAMADSPLIDACGKFLETRDPQTFYNVVVAYHRTPALGYILVMQYGKSEDYIPHPDIAWVTMP